MRTLSARKQCRAQAVRLVAGDRRPGGRPPGPRVPSTDAILLLPAAAGASATHVAPAPRSLFA